VAIRSTRSTEEPRGFLTKLDSARDLLAAIKAVRHKALFLSPRLIADSAAIASAEDKGRSRESSDRSLLSRREREIAKLLAAGRTNKEVANQLQLSTRTIEGHRARIMRKMKFDSMSDLIRFAVRKKWIKP
jgi:two-component system response regulator NreC